MVKQARLAPVLQRCSVEAIVLPVRAVLLASTGSAAATRVAPEAEWASSLRALTLFSAGCLHLAGGLVLRIIFFWHVFFPSL